MNFFKSIFKSLRKAFYIIVRWICGLLNDESGMPSSKRVVGLLSSMTLCTTLILDATINIPGELSAPLVNAVAALAFGSLGLSSIDKIWGKNSKKYAEPEKEKKKVVKDPRRDETPEDELPTEDANIQLNS